MLMAIAKRICVPKKPCEIKSKFGNANRNIMLFLNNMAISTDSKTSEKIQNVKKSAPTSLKG